MSNEYDSVEKVEQTAYGFRLTVESTRGTSTRDQDKVKAELRSETVPTNEEVLDVSRIVETEMERRREHQPDADDEEGGA